jgi:hypothetical protein
MPIENRKLAIGMRLVARYKKEAYGAEVVEGEKDRPRYRLDDNREFKSLSAAGGAITGKACNGWAFWSLAEAPAHAPEEGNCPTEDEMAEEERLAAEAGHSIPAETEPPARQRDARGHYLPKP